MEYETQKLIDKLRRETVDKSPFIKTKYSEFGTGWLILYHAEEYLNGGAESLERFRSVEGKPSLKVQYPGLYRVPWESK